MLDFKYKMVILIRTDLKEMHKGKAAVQIAHAAVKAADIMRALKPSIYKEWMREGQKKVVLKVSSLEKLIYHESLAKKEGIPCALIADAGLTQIPPGTITALGIVPITEEQAKTLELDELKLY
ncbi:MAG: peptidyl-tRNA hydrolase Pth2 [Candidatus Helarchaeota archaeon]